MFTHYLPMWIKKFTYIPTHLATCLPIYKCQVAYFDYVKWKVFLLFQMVICEWFTFQLQKWELVINGQCMRLYILIVITSWWIIICD
jgi:hypothetical protein